MLIEKQLLLLLQMLLPVDAAKTNLSIVFGIAKKRKKELQQQQQHHHNDNPPTTTVSVAAVPVQHIAYLSKPPLSLWLMFFVLLFYLLSRTYFIVFIVWLFWFVRFVGGLCK